MGDFIDNLIEVNDTNFIFSYFLLLVIVNLLTLVLGYVSARLYVRLQTILGYALNREFIQRLQFAPLRFTSQKDTVYLNQRINNDSNALMIFCISVIQNIIVNSIMVIVPAALLIRFHPVLACVLLIVAAVYFIFYILYGNVLYKASYAFKESQAQFFSKLNEQLFNIRFIKIHSMFSRFISRLNDSFSDLLSNALRYQHSNYIFSGLDKLVVMIVQIILLLIGGHEIIAGRLTIGRFVIISAFFNIMLGAMRYFFSLGQLVQSNMVSYNRLQEFAAIDKENNGIQKLDNVESIELKCVSFAYDSKMTLADISLKFEKGHIYAILGPNGAGKSTLIDIIMGLQIDNFTGHVLYNGISMEEVDMYDLRNRLMGVSEQEPTLLADTLENNLQLVQVSPDRTTAMTYSNTMHQSDSKSSVSNWSTGQLVSMLGLEAYFESLPDGLKTVISENYTNISGGERQKFSILRTLNKEADILILDEPTSALDTVSRNKLKSYLNSIKHDKIIILITHDRDFLSEDDIIFKLDVLHTENSSNFTYKE